MQWLREDPLGLTPDANPRRFVGNDPTNGTDPSGQQTPEQKKRFPYMTEEMWKKQNLTTQYINSNWKMSWLDGYLKNPLYKTDAQFKMMADELVKCAKTGMPAVPPPSVKKTAQDYWPELKGRQLPAPMSDEQYQAWNKKWNDLSRKLATYASEATRRASTPGRVRFVGGFLWAGAKAGNGFIEVIADFDKIPQGVWNLTTDRKTQARIIDEVWNKLQDTSWDNLGELAFEIPLTVTGAAGATKTGVKVASYAGQMRVTIPKAAAKQLKSLGQEATAKELTKALTNAQELPIAPGGRKVILASPTGSQTAPAKFVREVKPGEKISDLINEGKSVTWTEGVESAVVSLERSGAGKARRIVVTGGRDGIEFIERDGKLFMQIEGKEVQVQRVIGHTHPVATGPSQGDLDALNALGQTRSYIVEIGGAEPGAQIFRPK